MRTTIYGRVQYPNTPKSSQQRYQLLEGVVADSLGLHASLQHPQAPMNPLVPTIICTTCTTRGRGTPRMTPYSNAYLKKGTWWSLLAPVCAIGDGTKITFDSPWPTSKWARPRMYIYTSIYVWWAMRTTIYGRIQYPNTPKSSQQR